MQFYNLFQSGYKLVIFATNMSNQSSAVEVSCFASREDQRTGIREGKGLKMAFLIEILA